MVRQLSVVTILAGSLALAACSRDGDAPPAQAVTPEPPAARTPTVIDDQLKALDKAKAVQAELDAAEAERRRKLDEAGG